MAKKILKYFIMLCISMAILCSQAIQLYACGGWYEEDEMSYRFFSEEELNPPDEEMYGFGLGQWVLIGRPDPKLPANETEWHKYFKAASEKEMLQVDTLIFLSSKQDFATIENSIKKNSALPLLYRNNYLANYWKQHPEDPAFSYLSFAKDCESVSLGTDDWYEGEKEADTGDVSKLIEKGLTLHKSTSNENLRLRYAYQLVRLAHYSGRVQSCENFYRDLVESNKSISVIRYRAMNHLAGAYINVMNSSGDSSLLSKSMTLLAQVYTRVDRSMLTVAELDMFSARNYLEAGKNIRNKEDLINLWQLAGFKTFPLHVCIDKVYGLDPKSAVNESMLAAMMGRWQAEMKKFELSEIPEAELKEARRVIDKIAAEKKTMRPAVWNLAAGFLAFLDGDYKNSAAWYSKNKKLKDTVLLKIQSKLSNLLAIDQWRRPAFDRTKAAILLKQIDNVELLHYAVKKLSNVLSGTDSLLRDYISTYKAKGQTEYDWYYSESHFPLDLKGIENLVAAYHSPKDSFSAQLWRISELDEASLQNMKADIHVLREEYEAAAEIVKKFDFHSEETLPADPFTFRISDCHDCDHAEENKRRFTKYEFILRMAELSRDFNSTKTEARAQAYYEYANALYNTSFYGNLRNHILNIDYTFDGDRDANYDDDAISSDRGIYGLEEGIESEKPYAMTPAVWYDNRSAMRYYLKAADLSRDNEFKARCIFLAAKCEQNEFYNRGGEDPYKFDWDTEEHNTEFKALKNNMYRSNFRKLKAYSGTKFYKDAIRECSYFAHYAKQMH